MCRPRGRVRHFCLNENATLSSSTRLIHGFNRITLPGGVTRNLVPAHYQRARSNRCAGMNTSCWQCDRVCGQGSAVINGDGVQAHYAVLEKVCLHDGTRSNGSAGTNVTQVRFGEPIRLNPGTAADLDAE